MNICPKYVQIKNIVKDYIKKMDLKPGAKILSEPQLCQNYGVSRITVGKAIMELVNEGILYRNQGKGTFVANRKNNNNLALIFSGKRKRLSNSPFYLSIFEGIEQEAHDCELNLLFYGQCPTKEVLFGLLKDNSLSGIIFLAEWNQDIIPELISHHMPMIGVHFYYRDINIDYITVDNDNGACVAVKHLLNLGHKKIIYVGPNQGVNYIPRINAYRKTLKDAGISFELELNIDSCKSPYENGLAVKEKIDTISERPTAIFAATDTIAYGIISSFSAYGIMVPDDISVISFNGEFPMERHSTTVGFDKKEMGRIAVRRLLRKIEHPELIEQCEHVVMPPRLLPGDSCRKIKNVNYAQ